MKYVRRPTVYKFLNTNSKYELVQLSEFVKEALALRNTLLNVER
jgi:hypothetical protein